MFANVATVMVRPRETMRRVLDAGREWPGIVIVVLSAMSATVGDLDKGTLAMLRLQRLPFALLVAGILLGVGLGMLIIFYVFSWVAYGIGRAMEGTGKPSEVRSALAWGATPVVWALLYRVPAVFLIPKSVETKVGAPGAEVSFDPGRLGSGCVLAVIFGALELTVLFWCLYVASNTLGEAHRFSNWRGLVTLLLTALTPAIIAIAAFLAA